jgi:hypothetical protein
VCKIEEFYRRCRESVDREESSSGRTDLSRRHEARQIANRQQWGDLKPGQRSLNEPWHD